MPNDKPGLVRDHRDDVKELVSRGGALALKAIRAAAREVDFVASTDAVDSYGDVIDQASWQLGHYLDNPVVLYGHMSRDLPIGTASNVGVRNGQLECTIRFASAEANPMAEQVWKLVQEGVLRSVSVGFLPVEGRYEMRGGDEVFVWRSPILKEISVVPVPANPEALAKMKSAFAQKSGQVGPHGKLVSGETIVHGQGSSMRLNADGSIEIKNHPATPPATPNNPSGGATKKESGMDLAEALKIIETKSTEIGALTAGTKDLESKLAASEAKTTTANAERDAANAKLATLETEKAALVTQNAALVVERDAALAKTAEAEAASQEMEVDAIVGVKILPSEKDAYLALRKSNPALFKQMVEQRTTLDHMPGESIMKAGNDGKKGAPKTGGTASANEKVFGKKKTAA